MLGVALLGLLGGVGAAALWGLRGDDDQTVTPADPPVTEAPGPTTTLVSPPSTDLPALATTTAPDAVTESDTAPDASQTDTSLLDMPPGDPALDDGAPGPTLTDGTDAADSPATTADPAVELPRIGPPPGAPIAADGLVDCLERSIDIDAVTDDLLNTEQLEATWDDLSDCFRDGVELDLTNDDEPFSLDPDDILGPGGWFGPDGLIEDGRLPDDLLNDDTRDEIGEIEDTVRELEDLLGSLFSESE